MIFIIRPDNGDIDVIENCIDILEKLKESKNGKKRD